jgi:hypothetical protein
MAVAAYEAFLDEKAHSANRYGFAPRELPDFLFDFQAALVDWALRRGRGGIFADCGLGKTPMYLAWADAIVRHTNKAGARALAARGRAADAGRGGEVRRRRDPLERRPRPGQARASCSPTTSGCTTSTPTTSPASCATSRASSRRSTACGAARSRSSCEAAVPAALHRDGRAERLRRARDVERGARRARSHRRALALLQERSQQRRDRPRLSRAENKWRFKGHAESRSGAGSRRGRARCAVPPISASPMIGSCCRRSRRSSTSSRPSYRRRGMLLPLPAEGLQEQREEQRPHARRERCEFVAASRRHGRARARLVPPQRRRRPPRAADPWRGAGER